MTTPELTTAGAVGARRAARRPGRLPGAPRRPDGLLRAVCPPVDRLRATRQPDGLFPAARPPVDLLRALLVLGVAASVALHGQMALGGGHGPGWSVLMGVMAVLCLTCLTGLVRAADPTGTVRMTMGMGLAMALGHVLLLPLLAGAPGAPGAHSGHAHSAGISAADGAGAGHGGMLLVVGVELAVSAVAVCWIRRHNRRTTYRSV